MFASVLASPKKIIGSLVRRLRHPASKPTVSVKAGPAKPALKRSHSASRASLSGASTPVARASPLRHNDSLVILRENTRAERVVPVHGASGDILEVLKKERDHYNAVLERRQQDRRRAAIKARRPATQPSKARTRSLSDRKETIARRESSLPRIPGRNGFRAPSTASSSSFSSVASSSTITPSTVPSSGSATPTQTPEQSFSTNGGSKMHFPFERFGSLITERGSFSIPGDLDEEQEPVKCSYQRRPEESPRYAAEPRARATNARPSKYESWYKAAEEAAKVHATSPSKRFSAKAPFTPSRASGRPRKVSPIFSSVRASTTFPSKTASSSATSDSTTPSQDHSRPIALEATAETPTQMPRGNLARDISFMKVDERDPTPNQQSSSHAPRPLAHGPTVIMGEPSFAQAGLSREPSIMEIDRSFSFDSMDIESDFGNREFTPMDLEEETASIDPLYAAYDQACEWIRTAPAESLRYRDIPWPAHDRSVDLGGNVDGILEFFCGHPRISFGTTGREEFKQRLFQEYYQHWRHERFPWDKVHPDDEVEVAYGVDVVEQCMLKFVNAR